MRAAVHPASVLSTHWLIARLQGTRSYARGRLLDVGCGNRPYERFYPHTRYIGIDWPKTLHDSSPDVFADAGELPFRSKTFDTVICTELIEHVPDPGRVLAEIARVLAPDGCVILSAPFVHPVHEEPFDFFRFTRYGIERMLRDAGLQVVSRWERGGVVTVLVTVWCRFALGVSSTAARRAPSVLRRTLRTGLVKIVVRWPQAVAAHWLIDRRGRLADRLDNPTSLSLGFVVVARNGPASELPSGADVREELYGSRDARSASTQPPPPAQGSRATHAPFAAPESTKPRR